MKKIVALVFLILNITVFSQVTLKSKKILIIATNTSEFGTGGNGTLSWEIGMPFQYFSDHGYGIDIVTPKGGKVAVYDLIVPPELKKILESDLFNSKIKNSLTPNQVRDSSYCAVFYPGGYGQFVDVVDNLQIAKLTAKIYEEGGLIGTTGHGTASLINIKLSNSKYLIEGKRMTCFPLYMERKMSASNFGMALPFDMESVLKRRGADLVVCPANTKPERKCLVVVDDQNRIITGTGAFEAQAVAEEMIKFLSK